MNMQQNQGYDVILVFHIRGTAMCSSSTRSVLSPAVIAPPVRHSDHLHVVERLALDTETMELKRGSVTITGTPDE